MGEGDIDSILGKFVDLTNPILRQLLQRLTSDERAVVWLISQTVSDLADNWDYSLHTLAESSGHLPSMPGLDYDLRRGIDRLAEREWVEWKNQEKGLFHFRLGIFPLWMHRHHISPIL